MTRRKRATKERGIEEYTLADGTVRYVARITLPPDPVTGRRRRQSLSAETREEAIRLRRKLLVARDEGRTVDPSRLTVADLARRWLAEYAAARVKPKTYGDYEDIVRRYLIARPIWLPADPPTPHHAQWKSQ